MRKLSFTEAVRVIVVSGIVTGAIVVGLGSRVAMMILRLTSPDRVRGVVSDDGFVIGRVTLGGTYNLMQLGAAVGIIGACVYMLVGPRLIGPLWFRRLTTGLAAAAVGGAMLVHADGIDFTMLKPTWLAIGLFVALPGIFGAVIGASVDAVKRPDSWTRVGRRRWILFVIAMGCFPLIAVILVPVGAFVALCTALDASDLVTRARDTAAYVFAVRSLWLAAAAVGLVALVNDVAALA